MIYIKELRGKIAQVTFTTHTGQRAYYNITPASLARLDDLGNRHKFASYPKYINNKPVGNDYYIEVIS